MFSDPTEFTEIFYVSLTVHACIILCKQNQLGAQIFLICLLLFSTRSGQPRAHHQEKIPYLCDAWHLSLYIDDWYAGCCPAYQSSIYSDKCQVSHRYGIFS